MDCWERLGINVTTDKKGIKRAYAELAKTYHPEDAPEKFSKIRDAYNEAMAYASRGNRTKRAEDRGANTYEFMDYEPVDVINSQLDDESFDEFDNSDKEQMRMEALFGTMFNEIVSVDASLLYKSQIAIARRLMKGKNKESIYEWNLFLSSREFQHVKFNNKFVIRFLWLCIWSNGSRELFDEILTYYKLSEYESTFWDANQSKSRIVKWYIYFKTLFVRCLNNYLLKYDRDSKKEAIKALGRRMRYQWRFLDWFLLISLLLVGCLIITLMIGTLIHSLLY